MVLELLPFKWEWHNISMLYYNLTQVRMYVCVGESVRGTSCINELLFNI